MATEGGEVDSTNSEHQRVVLITGDDYEHHYLANRLAASVPLAGIVVDHGKKVGRIEKVRRIWRRYTMVQLFERVGVNLLRAIWRDSYMARASVLKVLGTENCSAFRHPELVSHVRGINTPEGLAAVVRLRPDILLVFGTGIVGQKVLSLPRRIALNMHTGVSPYYRGGDCTFWPVHNEELDMLGATVHECTSKVDGGRIFGTTRITLQKDDGLFSIFARCVAAGADLYARAVQQMLASEPAGTVQDLHVGREYKAHMRGVRAEWRTRRKIRAGLVRRHVERLEGSHRADNALSTPRTDIAATTES